MTGIDGDATLADALVRVAADQLFQSARLPEGTGCSGILNNRRLVRAMGQALEQAARTWTNFCRHALFGRALREEDLRRFYRDAWGGNDTVQEAIDAFEDNRKLLAVVVTEDGYAVGDTIVNLLTSADLPMLIRMLDDS